MKCGIDPTNTEVDSLQACYFLVKLTETFKSDFSNQFVLQPQNCTLRPQMGSQSIV